MGEGLESKAWASWLENCVKELFEIDPVAIGVEMVDDGGSVYTCYYNTSANDRALMIGGMRDDDMTDWVRNNREYIKEIIAEEDGGEEVEEESTTES